LFGLINKEALVQEKTALMALFDCQTNWVHSVVEFVAWKELFTIWFRKLNENENWLLYYSSDIIFY
jgi:hypothetical protein